MYFRKVIALLLVLVMSLSVVFAVADGNEPIIRDDANLLSEAEQEECARLCCLSVIIAFRFSGQRIHRTVRIL